MLLVVACGTVLLGTLYPLLIDALGLGKLSVGPPYFDAVFAPLMFPILFLMGAAPFARWKQASVPELARLLRWAFLSAAVVGVVAPFALGEWKPLVALSLLLAAWIVVTSALNIVQRVRATSGGLPASFLGMHLAHFGVAVFVVGVAIVNGYEQEKDVKMEVGDTVTLAGHTFRFNGIRQERGPNYTALVGDLDLIRNGRSERKLLPEKRAYPTSSMPMTEAAIDIGFFRDVYVSLGEPIDKARPEGAWVVRVYFKPFVDWIWGGCVLMSLGGLLAIFDRRYRRHPVIRREALPVGALEARS